jgi:hypothetical protein
VLVVLFSVLINRANARVVQSRRCAGFAAEALERLRILSYLVVRHGTRRRRLLKLDGDKAAKGKVFGLIDDAHTAIAQLLHNAVVRDGLTDHEILGCGHGAHG